MTQIRLRYVAMLNPAPVVTPKAAGLSEVSFLPMEAIGEDWTVDTSRTRRVDEVAAGYSYFEDGDIVFAKVTPCFENGKSAILEGLKAGVGYGTTEVTVVRSNGSVNTRYLFYILNEDRFRQTAISEMTGAGGLKRVPDRTVRDFSVDLPSRGIQDFRAAFLDRETAEIDAFIADQEELIGLLAERRAATISHAVTKGLDPTVPMKDSGVEWLGHVPQHWKIGRVGLVYKLTLGKMVNASSTDGDLHPYLRAGNIQETGVDLSEVKQMPITAHESAILSLKRGDVVVVEGGGGYGRSDVLREDLHGWAFQNHVIRARAIGREDPRLLDFMIKFLRDRGHFEALSAYATIPNLSSEKLAAIKYPLMPIEEQVAIADYLDSELKEISAVIADAKEAIALSRERRAALISAAVTGKIDVREHEAVA